MNKDSRKVKEWVVQPKLIFSIFIGAFMVVFPKHCFAQHKKQLTFNVDINSQEEALDVEVRGDLAPLSWYDGIKLSDPDNDGVYSTTVTFETPEGIEFLNYKYTLNADEWEGGENRKISLKNESATFKDTFRYAKKLENPFKKFIGEWKLKDDNWEYTDENLRKRSIKIPGHHTICKEINTNNSVLLIVDTGASHGSAFWNYDSDKKETNSLSSFSGNRTSAGRGTINANGDIKSKVRFQGVDDGRYRIYTYNWVSKDEYILKSVEYDKNDKPTGSYYRATFVRINK
ncbi:CBM20 domain-containing protein [Aquimarina mytili]|uniref:CBM20 domain-containing protein n=1 Tax=Aquimarina mytili TaxID=874423 RepID=A0A936ZZT6_9FLAO|nr:hypothetical protein [Aquimarina mytili]MBL0682445.1 hypothetical protein [Aquimarina mytili]